MSRKLSATILAGIGAAAAVVGIQVRSGQKAKQIVAATPAVDANLVDGYDPSRFVASLTEAIRCRTVVDGDGSCDSDEFDKLHDVLTRRYPLTHKHLERETFNEHSLLFTWKGSDTDLDPIVLMAHQDVVPVESGTESDWVVPPFSGEVRDDRIYGRGALDCKGPLIAILEATEFMLESGTEPRRTVYIVSGHDEEIGGHNGAAVIARELETRGVRPWFVVDEGGAMVSGVIPGVDAPVAAVGVAEKGYVDVSLTAQGVGGHSSIPPNDTSVVVLAKAIVDLDAAPMPARISVISPMLRALSGALPGLKGTLASHPEAAAPILSRVFAKDAGMNALQRTTLVPTAISAGGKSNVIPQIASVTVNGRIAPGDSIESVIAHIKSVVGTDIEVEFHESGSWEPSEMSATDSDGWNLLTDVIGDLFPTAIVSPLVVTGATDSRHFEKFSRDVYRFAPFGLDGEAVGGFHGTNEFVNVSDAKRAVSFYVRLIAAAATQDD